jgi:hypothetical protein
MATEIINLSVGLFILWAFLYFCYRDYRLDTFREELFIIRNELFEYAASGALPFDSPAYSLLRNFVNQMIRYAHSLTFTRYIIVVILNNIHGDGRYNIIMEWKKAVARIDSEEVRNKLYEFHNRIATSIAGQIFRRSIVMFLLLIMLAIIFWLLGSRRKETDIIGRENIERLENQVIEADDCIAELTPA